MSQKHERKKKREMSHALSEHIIPQTKRDRRQSGWRVSQEEVGQVEASAGGSISQSAGSDTTGACST